MLTDIQKANLRLVTEIDALCARHGIAYYLAGGSVIGALRHEGFIPWDDDIDVYLTRENWERFCTAFAMESPEGRFLHCSTIDPDFPNTIGQYGDMNTMAIYRHLLGGKFPAGISVDMFILDPVPADEEARAEHLKTLLLYADLVNPYVVYSRRFDVEIPYEHYLERIEREGRAAVLGELECELSRYNESECECYSLRWGGVPHFFEKELLGEPRRHIFEGIELPLPQHAHKYLTRLYGEEWGLLPQGAEVFTHNATMSATQSYKEFFEDFMPQFDVQGYEANALERKKNHLAMGAASRAVEDCACAFEAARAAMRVKAADERYDLRGLYERGAYDELWEHLGDYVDAQCSSRLWGDKYHNGVYRSLKPVYSEIDDELLAIVVDLLARRGEVYRPRRLLEVRAQAGRALEGELACQARALNAYNEAVDALEQADSNAALQLAGEALALRPEWPALIKLKASLLLREHAPAGEVRELIEAGKRIAPDDATWAKLEADLLWESDRQTACELYEQARANTRDGVMLLEIEKRLTGSCERTPAASGNAQSALQLKQLELLGELVDLCALHGIPCYLADKTALSAHVSACMPGTTCCPTLAVPMQNCHDLLQAISAQGNPQRVLDLQVKDTKRTGITVRYVARDTLWLDVRKRDAYEHAGIYVTVVFLEHEVGGLRKVALERDKKRFAAGKLDFAGLAKALSKAALGGNPQEVRQSNRRKLSLPATLFGGKGSYEEVHGKRLPLPADATRYLELLYGAGSEDSIDPHALNSKLIVDTELGYEQFKAEALELFADDELAAASAEWSQILKRNKEPERIHQDAWRLATRIAESLSKGQTL